MVHDSLFPRISTSKSQTGATPGLLPLSLLCWQCNATWCTLRCRVSQSPPGTGPWHCLSLMCSRQSSHILDFSADQILPHCFNCYCRWTVVNWETLPGNSSHLCRQNFFPVASVTLGIQMHLCGGSSWMYNEVQTFFLIISYISFLCHSMCFSSMCWKLLSAAVMPQFRGYFVLHTTILWKCSSKKLLSMLNLETSRLRCPWNYWTEMS